MFILVLLFSLVLISSTAFAQGMMGSWTSSSSSIVSEGHTAQEEKEGKEIWEKLQAKQITCRELTDDNFGSLGEYFMGQMVGSLHASMNAMMEQMMGKQGEEQMHIVMGKRLSGCDTSAQFPSKSIGFMPMMNMMMGMMGGGGNPMMGYNWGSTMGAGGWGLFGSLFWLFWVIVLVDLILLGIWLWKQIKKR